MLVRRIRFSSSAFLASVALFFAACSDDADSPGTMTGGTGNMAAAGTTSGAGTAVAGGGTTGSSGTGAGTAGAPNGSAGTPNGGGGVGAGGLAGAGGIGGTSAGAGGSSGNGGAAGAGGNAGASGSAGTAGSAGAGGAAAFQPCPTSGPCKIMPFGDSITQGYNVAGGYRAPLFHLALAANRNITFVGSANDYSVPMVDGMTFPKNHEGHGGYTIEGNNGIAQFVGTSIPNYQPDIITLMIGTNDINGNNNLPDAPNRLGKLLDSIFMRDANILVVLAQIVPTRTDGTNNAVKTYNAAMPNLVSTRVSKGQHVVLVDMYSAFTNDTNYKQSLLADNLHPNQAGYKLMADVWFQALSQYLH
jgi:lysophospholipase L1-like esterase